MRRAREEYQRFLQAQEEAAQGLRAHEQQLQQQQLQIIQTAAAAQQQHQQTITNINQKGKVIKKTKEDIKKEEENKTRNT